MGHSTGGGVVTRYIGRHGSKRVAKAVLVDAIPPLMLKTEANPGGMPIEAFDAIRAGVLADRSQFFKDFADPFYGANRPGSKVSQGLKDSFWAQHAGRLSAAYLGIKAWSETDHTEDPKKFDVPTLIIHGDDDQIVPIADSALLRPSSSRGPRSRSIRGRRMACPRPTRTRQCRPARLHQGVARWGHPHEQAPSPAAFRAHRCLRRRSEPAHDAFREGETGESATSSYVHSLPGMRLSSRSGSGCPTVALGAAGPTTTWIAGARDRASARPDRERRTPTMNGVRQKPDKEKSMDESSNRQKAEKAFRAWQDGTGSVNDLFADNLR